MIAGCKIEALKLALISENETFMKEAFRVFHNTDVSCLLRSVLKIMSNVSVYYKYIYCHCV